MAASKAGKVYLVDIKNLEAPVIHRWHETLEDIEKNSRVARVKVLGLLPGSRSYKCEVLGVRGTVKLSSKALAHVHACGSRTREPVNTDTLCESSGSVGDSDSEPSGDYSSSDGEPVAAEPSHYSQLTASDWQKVDSFADQCARLHPNIDKNEKGSLRRGVPKTPCDLFLEFFPLELVEGRFDHWVQQAEQSNRRGLSKLDQAMFMKFVSLLMKMSLIGLRRRALYFEEWVGGSAPALPQRTFENLLYTIRDAGFEPYEEHQMMPDGREAWGDDPLRPIRRFADELQSHWQDVYKPGFSMDE
jgi:hypothetical protein